MDGAWSVVGHDELVHSKDLDRVGAIVAFLLPRFVSCSSCQSALSTLLV